MDSFVDEARREVARIVAEQNRLSGAARSKCIADLGKVSRMEIVAPLPSCARDEEDEGFAGRPLEKPSLLQIAAKKLRDVLGIQSTDDGVRLT